MANFQESYKITMGHEGGYTNDPDDAGGETYRGISRRYNTSWEGWKIIDSTKETFSDRFEEVLLRNINLVNFVESFYKSMYWDKFQGDIISEQNIADELFDNAVNMGVNKSVTFLQQALNLLNRNQSDYEDILVDGAFGSNTIRALQKYLVVDNSSFLIKIMNILQGMHYINYMGKDPVQEKYARGWLRRVKL